MAVRLAARWGQACWVGQAGDGGDGSKFVQAARLDGDRSNHHEFTLEGQIRPLLQTSSNIT